MDRLLSCCLLTLDSHRTRFTELYICTRVLFIFSIVTEIVTLCVYVCVRVRCWVYVYFLLIWGYFVQKKQTHGQLSGARQNFHTELDVFYGDLVKFSLYFFYM